MRRFFAIVLCLVICATISAEAQTSSGRHRRRPDTKESTESTVGKNGPRALTFSIAGGLAASGSLFRLRSDGSSGIKWAPPSGTPVPIDNVLVTLDETVALSASLGVRILPRVWFRIDGSAAQFAMTALAKDGEVGGVFPWDELTAVTAVGAIEHRLTAERSYPLLFAGGGVAVIQANDDAFDQVLPALRLGAGYHMALDDGWGIRAEIRDTIYRIDLENYEPAVTTPTTPVYQLEDKGPTHFWEILLAMQGSF